MKTFIKVPFHFHETDKILQQIERNPDLWNSHPYRTQFPGSPHSQVQDIWLRNNCLTSLYDQEIMDEMMNGLEMVNYPAMELLIYARRCVDILSLGYKAKKLGRVLITKLPAGCEIPVHVDEGEYAAYYDRFHIVLQGSGLFVAGGDIVEMKTGEVWWFNNQLPHSVVNDMKKDRIHLVVDLELPEEYSKNKSHRAGTP